MLSTWMENQPNLNKKFTPRLHFHVFKVRVPGKLDYVKRACIFHLTIITIHYNNFKDTATKILFMYSLEPPIPLTTQKPLITTKVFC